MPSQNKMGKIKIKHKWTKIKKNDSYFLSSTSDGNALIAIENTVISGNNIYDRGGIIRCLHSILIFNNNTYFINVLSDVDSSMDAGYQLNAIYVLWDETSIKNINAYFHTFGIP